MRDVLARGIPFKFQARGSSMMPFIRDGDVITIAPLQRGGAGLGTIVAFTRPGNGILVVHRIVDISENLFFINGDNYPQNPDGWVPFENLLGRVVEVNRNGRRIWLGLGVERYLIAYLSRRNWLSPLRSFVAALRGRN